MHFRSLFPSLRPGRLRGLRRRPPGPCTRRLFARVGTVGTMYVAPYFRLSAVRHHHDCMRIRLVPFFAQLAAAMLFFLFLHCSYCHRRMLALLSCPVKPSHALVFLYVRLGCTLGASLFGMSAVYFRPVRCICTLCCVVRCLVAAVGVPACRSDVLGPAKEQGEVRGGYLWRRCCGALYPVLCSAVLAEEGRS